MPEELFIDPGGSLPVLSIYRAIIIAMFFVCFLKRKSYIRISEIPFISLLFVMIILETISLLLSVDFGSSIKPYLSFIIEIVLFYIIFVTGLKYKDIHAVLSSLTAAIIIVAVVGILERYIDFNPVDFIPITERFMSHRHEPMNAGLVFSTFTHPIMLGAALAMGWPLSLVIIDNQERPASRLFLRFAVLLILACLYFTFSRGPWLGLIVATIFLVLFRYPKIKKRLAYILVLTLLVFIVRPGTYVTLSGLKSATTNPEAREGSSFYYRLELWKVAYDEITKSPERLIFGYGQNARAVLNIERELSYDPGRFHKFYSWDNQLAATLLERGFAGLTITLLLYLYIIKFFIKIYKLSIKDDKAIIAALSASVAVFMFMTTNVLIFSHSLNFFFWINISIAVALQKHYYNSKALQN